MSKKLKNIGIVSLLTVVSRVLGLLLVQLQTRIFGESVFIDAFVTAFTLPNLFRRLLGEGSLTAAFVPTLQTVLHEEGEPGAYRLLDRVASWLVVVTTGLVVVAMVVCSQVHRLPGVDPKWVLAANLALLMFPYLALICVAAAFNATLNVFGRFTEPALSPIWLNVAMIVSLGGAGLHFADSTLGEVRWLCAGVLVGGFFQMAVPAAVLVHGGWRPRFTLEVTPRVRQIAALMTPGLFGTAIYQINITVSRLLAFSLPTAAALMFYANRLMELPIGVFAIAVSTVVYPLLAKHAAEGNPEAMAGDFRKGLRLILLINVPAAAGLALLSEPIVRLICQHGMFTAENTRTMSTLLMLFVIGLPFFSVVNLTVRAFYAVKDTATPVRVALVDFVLNLVLSVLLMQWLGVHGLVLASTAAIIVQSVLLQRALVRKLPGMSFAPLWPSVAKVMAATAVMAAVVEAGVQLLALLPARAHWAEWLGLGALIGAGLLAYGAMLWLLRIEGREDFVAMWARWRGKPAPV
ncbi:MAG: murein biosynthesis integral membrane protein MurJ [Opitutales bacterium]